MHSKVPGRETSRGCPSPFTRLREGRVFPALSSCARRHPKPAPAHPDRPHTRPINRLFRPHRRDNPEGRLRAWIPPSRRGYIRHRIPDDRRRLGAMSQEPVVSREGVREWETWSEEDIPKKGLVYWKTLISKGVTRSENLTLGVASLPPGGALDEHRHTQDEIYLVLEGSGLVRVAGEELVVEAGPAGFGPGGAPQ